MVDIFCRLGARIGRRECLEPVADSRREHAFGLRGQSGEHAFGSRGQFGERAEDARGERENVAAPGG